ncbi:hypothetical protein [Ancylobacter sp.]|uniref:hypothetical protein n=1 Tax=Ancylobacter sp. TaxID=1872567 RepID=UPI003BABE538
MGWPDFTPFVTEVCRDDESFYVDVEMDWNGNIRATLYGTVTRAEMLMSQAELNDMYDLVEEAKYWREEPNWSLHNRSIAEMCRLDSERPAVPHQIAAE